jgi:hypothetical protein
MFMMEDSSRAVVASLKTLHRKFFLKTLAMLGSVAELGIPALQARRRKKRAQGASLVW